MILILYYSCQDKRTIENQKITLVKIGLNYADVKFSLIIECRTCSESGLLFQRKLIVVGRWVGGSVVGGSVGRWVGGLVGRWVSGK